MVSAAARDPEPSATMRKRNIAPLNSITLFYSYRWMLTHHATHANTVSPAAATRSLLSPPFLRSFLLFPCALNHPFQVLQHPLCKTPPLPNRSKWLGVGTSQSNDGLVTSPPIGARYPAPPRKRGAFPRASSPSPPCNAAASRWRYTWVHGRGKPCSSQPRDPQPRKPTGRLNSSAPRWP